MVWYWKKLCSGMGEDLSRGCVQVRQKKSLNKVGGNKERCAVDGLAVEKVGRVVGNPVSKEASFVRAAQTICAKKPRKQSKSQKQKLFPTPRLALPGPLQQVCAMVVAGRSSHMGKKTHA